MAAAPQPVTLSDHVRRAMRWRAVAGAVAIGMVATGLAAVATGRPELLLVVALLLGVMAYALVFGVRFHLVLESQLPESEIAQVVEAAASATGFLVRARGSRSIELIDRGTVRLADVGVRWSPVGSGSRVEVDADLWRAQLSRRRVLECAERWWGLTEALRARVAAD